MGFRVRFSGVSKVGRVTIRGMVSCRDSCHYVDALQV